MTAEWQLKMMDDFRIYCGQTLFPELVRLERQRKRLVWFLYISIVLIAIFTYLTVITKIPALILFLWIPLTLYSGYIAYRIRQFQARFKPRIVNLMLEFIDRKMEQRGDHRAIEMETRIQEMLVEINDLRQQIKHTQLQLYFKIEKQLEGIERQLDSGMENAVLDLIKERMLKLQVEMSELQGQIALLKRKPIEGNEDRLREMEEEAMILQDRIEEYQLTLEEGLDKRIRVMEQRIKTLEKQCRKLRYRINNKLDVTLYYDHKGRIKRSDFIDSHIFMVHPHKYTGEDYIKGKIGETIFEMSELYASRYSPVRSKMNTLFQGIFFKAQYFFDAGGLVVIIPDVRRQNMAETIRYITQHGGGRVRVPYPDFEAVFETYATPNVKIESLLTKTLYEAILNYRERTGRIIYISFYKSQIYLAIAQDDYILEPQIFSPNTKFEVVEDFFEDLLLLFYLVEEFDLNH